MKCMKVCFLVAFAIASSQLATVNAQTTLSGKFVVETNRTLVRTDANSGSLAPSVGAAYTIIPALTAENPNDGATAGFAAAFIADPNTMAINDAIMDGDPDVIGEDLSVVFMEPGNPVVAVECLESLGLDPAGSGRFLLRLTLTASTTGTDLQVDSLTIDNQDPFDVDLDGELGKGPDGIYFTADDIVEPDGFFDSNDGTDDVPMTFDPPFVTLAVDLDGDGDTMNDPPSAISSLSLFIGANAGGTPIAFDPAGGPATVQSAIWQTLDVNGDIADIDGNGTPDTIAFDPTVAGSIFAAGTFDPTDGGWGGNLGFNLGTDGEACSINDFVLGNVRSHQLVVEYLSDIEPPLFCPPMNPGGCADPASFTQFRGLAVGAPANGDFAPGGTVASYNPGFVINNQEAPVWLIFDYADTASGSVEVVSAAGTPGLEMTAEYNDGTGFVVIGTAAESFGQMTTNVFALPAGVSVDQIRIGWRRIGFTINFPWQVNIDAVSLCQ